MDEKTLGHKLQLARKRAGLTQQELCQKAGLSYSTLAKIERGAIRSPSVFTVASIAEVTGTTLEELLGVKSPAAPALPAKKRSKSGVRFVYFDINGVVVRFFNRAFTQLVQDYGGQVDAVETVFWRYNSDVCTNKLSISEFNQILAKELGVQEVDWQKYYMDNVEAVSEVKELVRWAAENYQIGLLSDSMPGFIDGLRNNGLLPDENYAAIADSSKLGVTKSDPKMYEAARELAGVDANEILLIDDNRSNLIIADRAGWHVFEFDNFEPEESVKGAKQALEF